MWKVKYSVQIGPLCHIDQGLLRLRGTGKVIQAIAIQNLSYSRSILFSNVL